MSKLKSLLITIIIVIGFAYSFANKAHSTYPEPQKGEQFVQCIVKDNKVLSCSDITEGKFVKVDWTNWKK